MTTPTLRSGSPSPRAVRPNFDTCRQRRARISAALEQGPQPAALVLYAGDVRPRSAVTEYRFRPNADFYYLVGLAEPGAVMVLRPDHATPFTLFVRANDPKAELWNGSRIGPERATELLGADAVFPLEALAKQLPPLLDGVAHVHVPIDSKAERWVNRALQRLHQRNRSGTSAPHAKVDARDVMGEERLIKDPPALDSLNRAIEITAIAHTQAMRTARVGMAEFQIEALLEYEFRRQGASGPGYSTIVGSGPNTTILHYTENDGPLRDGDLLLIDAGAEWDLYTADLTRTFPVSNRFCSAQRDLYEVVLCANEVGIESAIVGNNINAIHDRVLEVLVDGLIELKLLVGHRDDVIANRDYERFYPHRTSHWLGADVHDVGTYCIDGQARPLVAGHVFTVEPGLYVRADDTAAPAAFRGIGIRIEDDVLVTDTGPEVLTHGVPKSIAEIEAIRASIEP